MFDCVNIKKATETAIKEYSELCYEDIRKINADDSKKKELLNLVEKLQNRDK